jgi:predicted PurR-regulated permease PerM
MTVTTILLLICAVAVTLAFILLVAYLLPVLLKFRDLMVEIQSTASEVRHLAISLQKTNERVHDDLERVDSLLATSRETLATVSTVVQTFSGALMKHSVGFFALLPAIRLGWSLVKRIKGGR